MVWVQTPDIATLATLNWNGVVHCGGPVLRGYAWLQETVLLDPADSNTIACVSALPFDLNATYLVFRDDEGALLAPGYRMSGRPARPPQRPVIEVIGGPSGQWLLAVREALAERGEGPATIWTPIFELVLAPRPQRAEHFVVADKERGFARWLHHLLKS